MQKYAFLKITKHQYQFLKYFTNEPETIKNILLAITESKLNNNLEPLTNLSDYDKSIYKRFMQEKNTRTKYGSTNGIKGGAKRFNSNAKKRTKQKLWTINQQMNLNELLQVINIKYKNYSLAELSQKQVENRNKSQLIYILKPEDKTYIEKAIKTKVQSQKDIPNKYLESFIDILPTISKLKNSKYVKATNQTPYQYMEFINNNFNYSKLFKRQNSFFVNEKLY